MRSRKTLLLAAAAMALSGCGGGGGGGGSLTANDLLVPPDNPSDNPPLLSYSQVLEKDTRATRMRAEIASEARPKFGGVTQSSNVDGVPSTTLDSVRLDFNGGEYTVSKTGPTESEDWHIARAESIRAGDKLLSRAAVKQVSEDSVVGLSFAVLPSSELGLSDNADYLSFGVWLRTQGGGDDFDIAELGVFVDGKEFPAADLPRIGTATYTGAAGGRYYANGDLAAAAGNFNAGVQLFANFHADKAHEVNGVMVNFVFENGEDSIALEDALNLHFATATFDSVQNGFVGDFNCLVGCGAPGALIAGGWGGKFFGGASAVDGRSPAAPDLFSGTFGFNDLTVQHQGKTATMDAVGVFAAAKGTVNPFVDK